MKTRTQHTVIICLGLMLIGCLLSFGWAVWQIYGPGGWRDEVYMHVGSNASREAMDDFEQGHLRLYTIGGESDKHRFTGRRDGPFEIWIPAFFPDLGRAHRYSTEQYIAFYNRKMRYMHSHPDRFLKKRQ